MILFHSEKAEQNLTSVRLSFILYGIKIFIHFYLKEKSGGTIFALPLINVSPDLTVVGGGGFEPPKSETSDLQSDAFGHSANRPLLNFNRYILAVVVVRGAGDWNRTRNLLITNQLLCQLSYTSKTA